MHVLDVEKVVSETPDSKTIFLKVPESLKSQFQYQSGQFVTVEASPNGESVQRCYSLSTASEVDSEFGFTVKEVSGGKLSPYLVKTLKEGDQLKVSEPAGRFVLEGSEKKVFFAAGSGVTPIFSMIKTVCHSQESDNSHRPLFIYSNRTAQDIIFQEELSRLPLDTVHVLSKPDSSWQGVSGRVSSENLEQVLSGCDFAQSRFYLCGPEPYMETIISFLKSKSVSADKIHFEKFDIGPAELPADLEDAIVLGEGDVNIADTEVTVVVDGGEHRISVKKDESILDATVRAGLPVPYSCMEGVCFACMARLDSGKVCLPQDTALDEDEMMEEKKILTCQSRALNPQVKVNYDEA